MSRHQEADKKRGFTLIEVLIVISIISVLASILLGYSRASNQQILLSTLVSRTEALIANARLSSIQTFFNDPTSTICAHGVEFDVDGRSARVFQLRKPTTPGADCPSRDAIDDYKDFNNFEDAPTFLTGESNQLSYDSIQIETSLEGTLTRIVFVPPDPEIIINGNGEIDDDEASLIINVGNMQGTVTVNKYGQVDTKYY